MIAETLGMEGSVERRGSLYIPAWTDSEHASQQEHVRTPSPEEKPVLPKPFEKVPHDKTRHRTTTENQYADTEVEELFAMLRESESLDEQGDILQYLVDSKGLDYNTGECVLLCDIISPVHEFTDSLEHIFTSSFDHYFVYSLVHLFTSILIY